MPTMPPVIGLMGRAQSGKDSVASRLVEEWGFTALAFAGPLKAMALAVNPVIDVKHHRSPGGSLIGFKVYRLADVVRVRGWEEAKRMGDTRRFLQALGTEGGREVLGQDVWVNAAMAALDRLETPAVFTDVRFPNEAEAIQDRGGLLIRLVRRDAPAVNPHPSETALDGWCEDLAIINAGTLADLHAEVDRLAPILPTLAHRKAILEVT